MSWLSDRFEEVVAQLRPGDKKTAATVRRDRAKARPAQTVRRRQPSFGERVRDVGTGVGLGAVRSVTGLGQGVSGLYDLATPGRGTNRFSKGLDRFARMTDQTVRNQGINNAAYKAGQFGTDALSFVGGGAAVKAASKIPQAARVAKPVSRIARPAANATARLATNVAARGAGGRIAAAGITAAARPSNIINMGLNTGLDLGSESGKGRDITPQRALLSAGTNVGFGIGLPMAGQAVKEGVRVAAPAVRRGAQVTTKLVQDVDQRAFTPRAGLDDQRAMRDFSDYLVGANKAAGSELSGTIAAARQAAQRQGVDISQGTRAQQLDAVNSVLDRIGESNRAIAEGGFAKLPSRSQNSFGDVDFTPRISEKMLAYDRRHGISKHGRIERNNSRVSRGGYIRLAEDAEANVFSQNPINTQPRLSGVDAGVEQSPLPVLDTKKVGNLDKAFRSTRSIIERQGASGRELAGKLQSARDTQEMYLAELQRAMPTVTELARKGRNALVNKDFENFVDATQGIAKPNNARVAKAIGEWQATHPLIRDRAIAAGLDVGDLGKEYYPHFIDYERVFKDKNTYNQAINHLVETGQAPTQEEAIKLLSYARDVSRNRQFGNLEASRLVDLPFYDKTPNSLIGYLGGSAKRIAQTETFGAKDEEALKLIRRVGVEGGDTEAAKNAYDVAVGAKQYNPTTSRVSSNIRKYITTTRLGLGALTNVSQNVNTGIVTGHLRTLTSAIKQLDPKTRAFVGETGVIADAVLNDLRTQQGYESFSQKILGKAINKITAPGFGLVEKVNRSIAATAGRDYALRLAQLGKVDTLRKLGVKGPIRDKTLTMNQQIQAARKIVEKTQFKVDPQDLPGWVDTPGGKLVAQFRTFSYNQGKFFSNEILKPLAKGDAWPLGRLLAALPLGYALYETRRIIDGRPQEEDPKKVGLASFQKVGGAGLAFDLYQSLNPVGSKYIPSDRRTSMAVGAFGGPAVGVAAQAAGALSEAVQRKNTPEDETRLEGKVVAGKNETYTDLTPAARFGLQQIPIVGTPIKNRLLPFIKESEADRGKSTGNKGLDKSIASAGEVVKANKKSFESRFSKEDLELYRLSKAERKQLVEQGVVEQSKFDSLDKYARNVKRSQGQDIGKKDITLKNDSRGSEFVNSVGDLADKDKWKDGEFDAAFEDIYKRASQIRFEGLPDLPKNNRVLSLYADLLKKREKGLTKLGENKAKLRFLKEAYKTDLPKESQEILSASTSDILNGINEGIITPDQVARAVDYDDILLKTGLSSSADIPKKVRSALGLGSVSSRGKRSGSRKASKRFAIYDLSPGTATNRSLRQILERATL